MKTKRVFISAVRTEFEADVLELTRLLKRDGFDVENQFSLGVTVVKTLQKLFDAIEECDLVVHLVGSELGSEPEDTEIRDIRASYPNFLSVETRVRQKFQARLDQELGKRWSYTQWEAYIAIAMKKRMLCFSPAQLGNLVPQFHLDAMKGVCYANPYNTVEQIATFVLENTVDPDGKQLGVARPLGPNSYHAEDAIEYRQIAAGPHDDDGMPQSLNEWCRRIRECTFSIGTIHGPSGSGKSSWIQAGLMPLVDSRTIQPIFVQASRLSTERDIYDAMIHRIPAIKSLASTCDEGSIASLISLVQSQQQRCLLIIDQFEQWLEQNPSGIGTPLYDLLCKANFDDFRVLLLYRSDWQHQIKRFLSPLGFQARSDTNDYMIDTFNSDHAKKVLTYFGRYLSRFLRGQPFDAFGECHNDHGEFIEKAVLELTDKAGQVLAVHLSIFAWMVRDKEWTPETLKSMNESGGPGVLYLRSYFEQETPKHLKGATRVLEQLLPAKYSKNKIRRRRADLAAAVLPSDYQISNSDHQSHPAKLQELVEDLLDILEHKLRVISRVDSLEEQQGDQVQYQFSHDYMIVSVRKWFTGMQATNDELAERLLLEERMIQYRHSLQQEAALPTFQEWRFILENRDEAFYTKHERQFMQVVARYHGKKIANELLSSRLEELPEQLADIKPIRDKFGNSMRRILTVAARADNSDVKSRLKAILCLQPHERDTDADAFLYTRLFDCLPVEIEPIVSAIETPIDEYRLRSILRQEGKEFKASRMRAAAALAIHQPHSPLWDDHVAVVFGDLVQVSPTELPVWLSIFSPVSERLASFGSELYSSKRNLPTTRLIAIDILANFVQHDTARLAMVLLDSEPEHVDIVMRKIELNGSEVQTTEILQRWFADHCQQVEGARTDLIAARLANAVLGIFLFDSIHDPGNCDANFLTRVSECHFSVRSYITDRIWYFGVELQRLYSMLKQEALSDDIRSLLLSCIGNNSLAPTTSEGKEILQGLDHLLDTKGDRLLHGTMEWLLRKWKNSEDAQASLSKNATGDIQEWLREFNRKNGQSPSWFVNQNHHKMILFPGNQTFIMGSPDDEPGRGDEKLHRVTIPRSFALSAHHVTWKQFVNFCDVDRLRDFLELEAKKHFDKYLPRDHYPVHIVSWHMAALYCNWLSLLEGLEPVYLDRERFPATLKPDSSSVTPIVHIRGDDALVNPGYRLPTEAEVEFCARAGSTSAYFFGNDIELLTRYGWYALNGNENSHPVGELLPNAFGFFDTIGNCYTWCQDILRDYVSGKDYTDCIADSEVVEDGFRVARGGAAHFDTASDVRSAYRYSKKAKEQTYFFSFRIARTIKT